MWFYLTHFVTFILTRCFSHKRVFCFSVFNCSHSISATQVWPFDFNPILIIQFQSSYFGCPSDFGHPIGIVTFNNLPNWNCKNYYWILNSTQCSDKSPNNVALLCVRGVRKIFSTGDDAKRVRDRSFLNEPQASSENIFRGRVWHHQELELSFGRQEHTVISLLFKLFAHLTRKIVKSMGEIVIALYNNDHYCTVQ